MHVRIVWGKILSGQWNAFEAAFKRALEIRGEAKGLKSRHLSVHRGHNLDVSNGHDRLVDVSAAKQMTFTGTREELRERLTQLEARGATGIIFGTSGYDVERELRAYAEVAGLR